MHYSAIQWRSKEGGKWGHVPWAKALRAHQRTFYKHLKTRFKQKFRPKYA